MVRMVLSLDWASAACACKILHLGLDLVCCLFVWLPHVNTGWLNRCKADFVSAFPAGVNVAATWDKGLANARGQAMGAEHHGKGVDIQLGPVAGPLGRAPEGGRNWEGFR